MVDKGAPRIGFIGGSGRSGTTILKRIFRQHPQVASVPECRIMIDPGGLLDFYRSVQQNWSPFLYDQRLQMLKQVLNSANRSTRTSEYGSALLRKAGIRSMPINLLPKDYGIALQYYDELYSSRVKALLEALAPLKFSAQHTGMALGQRARIQMGGAEFLPAIRDLLGGFYRELTVSIAKGQQANFFIDDNTWNILYMDGIRELLPGSRLVHIVRDPRDVIASFTQQTWAPSDPVEAGQFYRSIMLRWNHVAETLPAESFRMLRLEDLVAQPEPILRELCSFWDLEWDNQLLTLELNQAHTGRWKKDLPTSTHNQIHELIHPFLTQFDYE